MYRHLNKISWIVWLWVAPVWAQTVTLDLGNLTGSATGRLLQLMAALTIVALAPSILIMVTSFTRIVVVLSFLRSALGVQQSPPNAVLISLAVFLTGFVMSPTLERTYDEAVKPLMEERISEEEAWSKGVEPFHEFMSRCARPQDIALFTDLSRGKAADKPEDVPLRVLVPAFMISELKRAFEIGFLIFLPFLIIDMVVASILMSMGMMMLPPVMIAMPFKLIFFVLVDGWQLICGSLVKSFG
jgi:flagellar biosynthetic protein FliP